MMGVMPQGVAAQFAGRLSFSVTVTASRCGRAFLCPFYAQVHDPLQRSAISFWLGLCVEWWLSFLSQETIVWRSTSLDERQHIRMWSDASGESRRLAALVQIRDEFFYTALTMPSVVWDSLIPRDDNQIGLQELMAVLLGTSTFKEEVQGAKLSS